MQERRRAGGLNSIAAGYAVDRISERMDAFGLHDYLVQATGELKVSGLKPDGSPWRVTLDAPLDDGNVTQKYFRSRAMPFLRRAIFGATSTMTGGAFPIRSMP